MKKRKKKERDKNTKVKKRADKIEIVSPFRNLLFIDIGRLDIASET